MGDYLTLPVWPVSLVPHVSHLSRFTHHGPWPLSCECVNVKLQQ